mgnify:CR=1 FL=1
MKLEIWQIWLLGYLFYLFGALHRASGQYCFIKVKDGQSSCSLDCISVAVALCSLLLWSSDSERIIADFVSLFLPFALFSVLPVARFL